MIFFCCLLGCLLSLSSIGLYFSVKKNLQFLEQQEELLQLLENSTQELDICYNRINKKSKMELFSDDQTVKDLVDDMKQARQAVSTIIEKLTGEKDEIQTIEDNS